jgi:hypothetical protein
MPEDTNIANVSLSFDAVRSEALRRADLRDFGDTEFFQPLRVLLAALRNEAQLSNVGRDGQFNRIVELLVNRLRVQYWLQRHPEILDEQIEAPVVIVGLMRTGTTMLHRLMACDEQFYAPLWYETRYPAPLPGYRFTMPDARIPVACEEVRQMLAASPELATIHPLDACAADEEIMLLEHSFYSTVPESFASVPSYAQWLASHDNTPGYRYLFTLLQFLQWQKKRQGRSANRWLLKTPHHLHHLDVLLRVFPGATVIQTHRDPLQTIPSLCSMNYALSSMGSDHVDAQVLGRHWRDKFACSLERALAVRAACPDQFVDVLYTDTAHDPLTTVRDIYAQLKLPLADATQAAMQQWLLANQRVDRAPHHYTLDQFGFTREDLENTFAAYRKAFLRS